MLGIFHLHKVRHAAVSTRTENYADLHRYKPESHNGICAETLVVKFHSACNHSGGVCTELAALACSAVMRLII